MSLHTVFPFPFEDSNTPCQFPILSGALPILIFYSNMCSGKTELEKESCRQELQCGIDTGNEAFASICKSLRRATGQ
jgi:hypothetical protein